MKDLSSIKFPRPAIVGLTVIAAAILILPTVMLTMRRHGAKSPITPSQVAEKSPSPKEVSRNQSSLEKICFIRGAWIWVANLATGKERRIAEGGGAQLSPAGDSLVFLSVKEKENEDLMMRWSPPADRLRVLNLSTGAVRDFPTLREGHIGDPLWSNDGTRIAVGVSTPDSKVPSIVILNAATGDVERKVTGGWDFTTYQGLFLNSWTPGDQSILFHTFGALFELRIDSGIVEKVPIDNLFESGDISSSATQFSFSSDRRYLLFDGMIDTPDEPATEVIYVYDLTTKTLRRVTPKGVHGRSPVWLPSNKEILFTQAKWVDGANGHWELSICKIAIDGTGLKTLVRNADYASYSVK
jgi:Tol biopolymer transport system component